MSLKLIKSIEAFAPLIATIVFVFLGSYIGRQARRHGGEWFLLMIPSIAIWFYIAYNLYFVK